MSLVRLAAARVAYRLRWKRRRLLWRARRAVRDLSPVVDRTAAIPSDGVVLFVVLRNEAARLPHFLDHYRRLGVAHVCAVVHQSTDASESILTARPDVSVWRTAADYRASRFGMDWTNALLRRHGQDRWCLTVDADELLIYPHWETRDLGALTDWLDREGRPSFGAMLLDLYPDGDIREAGLASGENPLDRLRWFDSGNYATRVQPVLRDLRIQGGPRARSFFADQPVLSPTLNKVPLVRWSWRYAYVNATHTLLPRRLNATWDTAAGEPVSGLLLHTKFLAQAVGNAAEDVTRQAHFARPELYRDYNLRLAAGGSLHVAGSRRLGSWRELEALGLLSRGGWP
jgi:hypothetical protein